MKSEEVKGRIESGLQHCKCYVTEFSGGNDHYSVIVVSTDFNHQSRLKRHRMVMDLFKEEVDSGEVHALSIRALTPEEWEQQNHRQL